MASSTPLDILLLPGDGIGIEVMREGRKVLEAALEIAGVEAKLEEIECGGEYYLKHGVDWPEGTGERCKQADVIFLGAVGWPDPEGDGPVTMKNGKMAGYSPVIGNRVALQLYANVRPVKLYPGVKHKIHGEHTLVWDPAKVDILFIRENTEGLYTGIGGRVATDGKHVTATDTRIITRTNSERVIRYAFEAARRRKKGPPAGGGPKVTALVKDNVLEGCRFFRDVFFEIAKEYPDVEAETAIIDAYTQWLVQRPEWYDVVVTTNMFGDIITDLASVLQGGMGLAVGCNVGDEHAMFEPIHGSAPKHAGKDKANPLATILSVKEGLDWLGNKKDLPALVEVAAKIEAAVAALLEEGKTLTYDMVGEEKAAKCSEVGDAVVARLKA
ncbi:MAG: isocitrate/isopropylmalate dehydrogenase family protein [Deltaproteobacteria bacterium]|nr:isocitrate/isopropylmalate dehydrogenase family protein [Deltaproteobacteria bacterium]